MKRFILVGVILGGFVSMAPSTAQADACAPAAREMTYGETAVEVSKTPDDYLKAAEQFRAAARKAPKCTSAQFNLGVVLEKAGQYLPAKKAFETYLKLAPKAKDTAAVTKKIYRLEYLAQENAGSRTSNTASSPWKKLEGRWCTVSYCRAKDRAYDLTINNDQLRIAMRERNFTTPSGCRISSREDISGTISADGSFQGTLKTGDKRYESRCTAGSSSANRWNFLSAAITGKVVGGGSRIYFQWKQHVGRGRYEQTERNMRRF